MDTLFNAFLAALDLCFYYFVWQGAFSPKVSRKRYFLAFGAGWLALLLLQCSGISESGKYLLAVPLLIALSLLINDGYWADHLYAVLVGVALGGAIVYSVSVSFSAIIHVPLDRAEWYPGSSARRRSQGPSRSCREPHRSWSPYRRRCSSKRSDSSWHPRTQPGSR